MTHPLFKQANETTPCAGCFGLIDKGGNLFSCIEEGKSKTYCEHCAEKHGGPPCPEPDLRPQLLSLLQNMWNRPKKR